MVEHLVCNQGVVGSNPVASTRGYRELITFELFYTRGHPIRKAAVHRMAAFFDIQGKLEK